MSEQYIVFSHGQDGEPWGTKILVMAEVARAHGLTVESVDYRNMPDPAARVEKLLDVCKKLPGELILVGSSLGAHVCTTVSTQVMTRGLFLLAPAFFMPGYERYTPTPPACPVDIVHGWSDDVVPVDNSIRYARQYKCALHILDSDHRLTANIDDIRALLDRFLQKLLASA